jgi:hypothetical protein
MKPETTPQTVMIFSSPPDKLVLMVTVSPDTSTTMMLSYHDVLKPGTPKISARYFLIAFERGSSVIDVVSTCLISCVNSTTWVELAWVGVLADARVVKKSADIKLGNIEKTDRNEMRSMLSFLVKWIAVGKR